MPEPEQEKSDLATALATAEVKGHTVDVTMLDDLVTATDNARHNADLFHQHRVQAAEYSAIISDFEIKRTKMRHDIVARLMAPPSNLKITAATDQARLSPEYVELSKEIIEVTRKWETSFASAEHHRMLAQLLTLDIQRDYDKDRAKAELGRLGELIEQRIRSLQ